MYYMYHTVKKTYKAFSVYMMSGMIICFSQVGITSFMMCTERLLNLRQ